MFDNLPNRIERYSSEWDAAAYHEIAHPQFTWGYKVLNHLYLQGNETVMDAGCGSGRITAELLKRLPEGRVIAVDFSEKMLYRAYEYLTPEFGNHVSFIHADLQILQMNEIVDVVFSTACFHWIHDHSCLFQNLYQTLKPGGWLVAQCGGGANLTRVLQRASILMRTEPYVRFFVGWSDPWIYADEASTINRLLATGFANIETNLNFEPTSLANTQEYHSFLTHIVFRVHLTRLPTDNLRSSFISTLTEQAAGDSPPFLLDYWRLNMRGQRPANCR